MSSTLPRLMGGGEGINVARVDVFLPKERGRGGVCLDLNNRVGTDCCSKRLYKRVGTDCSLSFPNIGPPASYAKLWI